MSHTFIVPHEDLQMDGKTKDEDNPCFFRLRKMDKLL